MESDVRGQPKSPSRKRQPGLARGHKQVGATRLEQILNSVPHVIWSSGPDGQPDFISSQWTFDYGGDPSELVGQGWISLVHPDDVEPAVSSWLQALTIPEPYQNEFRLRVPSGEYRWVLVTAKPELGPDGRIRRWFGTCTDVHERFEAQRALAEKERLYRSVLEASADCIKILTPDGRLKVMNEPGLRLMELSDFSKVEGKLWSELWPEEMQARVGDAVQRAAIGQTVRFDGQCPTSSGLMKWWDIVVTPICCTSGRITGILAISRDSTAEREKSRELEWASEHDALCGLPNRRAFHNRLQAAVLRSMRDDTKVGLLLIDLDHFKHVNDTLGHSAGDALLKEFARRLKGSMRTADFVGRIGGDEFAIIVENINSASDLLGIGEKAAAAMKTPLRLEGRALSSGASIGAAIFPDDADSANDLFKLADTALYALKSEGRGGTKLFQAYMRAESQRIASQLSLARIAVNEDSVRPQYQPKVSFVTGAAVGFEALLRWEHPTRGLQHPETIEEAFKDYELASKIGELMQNKVLADIRSWLAGGFNFGRVSINAAPSEFLRDDYAERLLARARSHGVCPSVIEIEVTEHVLMAHASRYVLRALAALKAAGVTIALDDFGTGHSSLSHLRDFPVDVVKIDKSFVNKMVVDPEISAIVLAVISLAKSLKIQSVAEGVETKEQADLLASVGCDLAQGYLYGRPENADVIAMHGRARSAA